MGERDNGQNHRGNDRPADREGKDVPVPTDPFDERIAHVAIPQNGELGKSELPR